MLSNSNGSTLKPLPVGRTSKESEAIHSKHNFKDRPQHTLNLIWSHSDSQVSIQKPASTLSNTVFTPLAVWWQRFVQRNCGKRRMEKWFPHFRAPFVSSRLRRVALSKSSFYHRRSRWKFPPGLNLQLKRAAASKKQEKWIVSIDHSYLRNLLSWRAVRSRRNPVLREIYDSLWNCVATFWRLTPFWQTRSLALRSTGRLVQSNVDR